MAWNHRSRVVAMAVAIQVSAGTFVTPVQADMLAVSVPNNNYNAITADDPTATGGVWAAAPVYLGKTGTAGATAPLRGPGGASPPAANAWPLGRILQAAGWTELRNGAAITGEVLVAGSTTTALKLATTQSSVDDALIGVPVTQANIGTGFKATSLIMDYVGSTRLATIPETIIAPGTGDAYTIPAYLSYVLGTLTTAPPKLSVSIWRDKKRYDYVDWQPTSLTIDVPVANEANAVFPSIEFTGSGTPYAVTDEASPTLLDATLAVPVAPARGGKFVLDRVVLGHQSLRFTEGLDVGAASNQNQATGQDGYDILSGTRTIDLDLNQMAVSDFNVDTRVDSRTVMPILSTWGLGAGNKWGLLLPANTLDPLSPGDRNGYVSLTGNAAPTGVDKSAALAIWW